MLAEIKGGGLRPTLFPQENDDVGAPRECQSWREMEDANESRSRRVFLPAAAQWAEFGRDELGGKGFSIRPVLDDRRGKTVE